MLSGQFLELANTVTSTRSIRCAIKTSSASAAPLVDAGTCHLTGESVNGRLCPTCLYIDTEISNNPSVYRLVLYDADLAEAILPTDGIHFGVTHVMIGNYVAQVQRDGDSLVISSYTASPGESGSAVKLSDLIGPNLVQFGVFANYLWTSKEIVTKAIAAWSTPKVVSLNPGSPHCTTAVITDGVITRGGGSDLYLVGLSMCGGAPLSATNYSFINDLRALRNLPKNTSYFWMSESVVSIAYRAFNSIIDGTGATMNPSGRLKTDVNKAVLGTAPASFYKLDAVHITRVSEWGLTNGTGLTNGYLVHLTDGSGDAVLTSAIYLYVC